MNISLNLLKITSKKRFLESKSFINSVLFRNIYSFYAKKSSNYLINGLVLKNNDLKAKKLLIVSFESSKMPSMVCLMSSQEMNVLTYERMADQTLDHLNEELEQILEQSSDLTDTDISLSSGVMTLNLGKHGIYVINKQTPNQQIWLSSPISGPKRYDYVNNDWIYKRDGNSLYCLLNSELSVILKRDIKIKPFSHLSN